MVGYMSQPSEKIFIAILMQPSELEVTCLTLDSLLFQTCNNLHIALLINGDSQSVATQISSVYPEVDLYISKENLGVAGGRNFLFQTTACQNSDFILLLDNDVIVPKDYVESLLPKLRQNIYGVIGSVVLNYRPISKRIFDTTYLPGRSGQLVPDVHNLQLQSLLKKNFHHNLIFHIGMHPDVNFAYFSTLSERDSARRLFLQQGFDSPHFSKHIKNCKYKIENIAQIIGSTTPFEVSNVAGCCQAFTRKVLSEVGLLDDGFSPYGFEDADFCIRAKSLGYKNVTIPDCFLIHGTDNRHRSRQGNMSQHLQQYYRALAYLYQKHVPERADSLLQEMLTVHYMNVYTRGQNIKHLLGLANYFMQQDLRNGLKGSPLAKPDANVGTSF